MLRSNPVQTAMPLARALKEADISGAAQVVLSQNLLNPQVVPYDPNVRAGRAVILVALIKTGVEATLPLP